MKSTNKETKAFSLEDFEKGLMLAGYISPNSISEVHERNELDKYEKQLDQDRKNVYFKRAVLAAEIASQLHNEKTFGHVKFQKLVYLCEQVSSMNISNRYMKKAAGPFDNKFMHSIDKEFKDQKWFNVIKIKEGAFIKFQYIPLENLSKYKQYYDNYFKDFNEDIQWLINTFRNNLTNKVELVATLYACWIEIIEKKESFSDDLLFKRFYEWSKEKGKFTTQQLESCLKWMIENELVPFDSKITY